MTDRSLIPAGAARWRRFCDTGGVSTHIVPHDGLRVVIATRIFGPEGAAAALRLTALARSLADAGCDVRVVTSAPPTGSEEQAAAFDERIGRVTAAGGRVSVARCPVLRDRSGAVRGYLPYMSFDIPLFFRLVTMTRADVVVNEPPPTTGVVTMAACAIRRIPHVYYAADIVSDAAKAQGTHRLVVGTVRRMEALAMRGASRVIAVSDGVADRVRSIAGRGADIVPNGIDTSTPIDEDPAAPLPVGFPQTPGPVFVYAGTVAEWLAPEVFIDAFERVRDALAGARLVFLGQGGAWEALKERAHGARDIIFHDLVSAEEARSWYAAATASLASIRPGAYDYAYPTKLLSSLACGTPVIYAGPGQARRDVRGANLGWAVGLDAHEVAEAMREAASCPPTDPRRDGAGLRRWVDEHRSVRASSAAAADIVMSAARREDQRGCAVRLRPRPRN